MSFNRGRDASRILKTTLSDWVSVIAQRLKQRGWAHLNYRIDRID